MNPRERIITAAAAGTLIILGVSGCIKHGDAQTPILPGPQPASMEPAQLDPNQSTETLYNQKPPVNNVYSEPIKILNEVLNPNFLNGRTIFATNKGQGYTLFAAAKDSQTARKATKPISVYSTKDEEGNPNNRIVVPLEGAKIDDPQKVLEGVFNLPPGLKFYEDERGNLFGSAKLQNGEKVVVSLKIGAHNAEYKIESPETWQKEEIKKLLTTYIDGRHLKETTANINGHSQTQLVMTNIGNIKEERKSLWQLETKLGVSWNLTVRYGENQEIQEIYANGGYNPDKIRPMKAVNENYEKTKQQDNLIAAVDKLVTAEFRDYAVKEISGEQATYRWKNGVLYASKESFKLIVN